MSAAAAPSVTVLVPAYNEALVIEHTLERLTGYLHSLEPEERWEVLVVDDGSDDGTGEIAERFAATHPGVRVIHHPVNFGLGQALRFGFSASRGDAIVVMDCDLSYSPEHISALLSALRREHARVALASPYMKGGATSGIPFLRRLLSRGANRLLAFTSKGHWSTVTGMVRAYDRVFVQSLNLKATGPEINTELLYKAELLRARIVEVPAHLDWSGQAERLQARGAIRLRIRTTTLLQIFSGFLFRPLFFFVVPGLLLAAQAAWTLWAIAADAFAVLGSLPGPYPQRLTDALAVVFSQRPHSFLVGGFCLLASLQMISLGLLSIQMKRYFEELFHLGTRQLRRLQALDEGTAPRP
jgi:glycosyltransferase involved in cell wall biosynthesis